MKLFKKMTDGGPDSNSIGWFLIESKALLSVVFLKFTGKTREVFHEHAFHSIAWLLKGVLLEKLIDGRTKVYYPSWKPFMISRRDFHQVSVPYGGPAYVFSFRGPWKKTWKEAAQDGSDTYTLTHGRKRV